MIDGETENETRMRKQLEYLRTAMVEHLFYTTSAKRDEAEDIVKRLFDRAEVYSK